MCRRERMGVEPTEDTECPPTGLKPAKPTGTYPPPYVSAYLMGSIFARERRKQDRDESLKVPTLRRDPHVELSSPQDGYGREGQILPIFNRREGVRISLLYSPYTEREKITLLPTSRCFPVHFVLGTA